MEFEIEAVRQNIKKNKHNKNKTSSSKNNRNNFSNSIIKILITIVLTLSVLIAIRSNKNFKEKFYKEVYEKNFSFATVNESYKKYFGEPIPFFDMLKSKTQPVFSEKLIYDQKEAYKDGVKLTTEKGYLVPALEGGMVVFVGKKENYGQTVVVQQANGIDLWYGNMKNISIKLYDYVEKGSLVGEINENNLYLVYKKDGKIINYEEQLPS